MDRKGKRFLVIEDNADDAFLIRRAFGNINGCEAFICRNSSEAKAYLLGAGMYSNRERYGFPDAIICDLQLGEESGAQLIGWLKKDPKFNPLPVIVLTGGTSPHDVSLAQSLGVIDTLIKPSKFEELQSMIGDLTRKICV